MATRIVVTMSLAAFIVVGCASIPPGGPPPPAPQAAPPAGADLASSEEALNDVEHVSAMGAYQTSFPIPVPSAPAAPSIALNYSSEANTSLAGAGWDLSVGYPLAIIRDVRFGTPQWKFSDNWLWGSTPLVRMHPKDPLCQQGNCVYRVAPEGMITVSISLNSQPAVAQAHLPSGTTLTYEPILYDGKHGYPTAPAGADTSLLAFRLVSVVDRNGYLACLTYSEHGDIRRGQVADLHTIVYGLTPSQVGTCGQMLDKSYRSDLPRHVIELRYEDLASSGFFPTWTLRFGAPVSFKSLLTGISVTAAGVWQDTFCLDYGGQNSETRRPRLSAIRELRQDSCASAVPAASQRTLRTFAYGDRKPQYGDPALIDMGELGRFPDSIAGTSARPMQRLDPLSASNLFQVGKDQDTDAAPGTFATTEEWSLADINGDGLPDFQWAKESGIDPSRPWDTFANVLAVDPPVNPPSGYDPATDTTTRAGKPQQEVLINDGVASNSVATSRNWIQSRAHTLEDAAHYYPVPNPPLPTPALPPGPSGVTSWIWGEGRGQTRTGMPLSISAPELTNPAPTCAGRSNSQDPRIWPVYPDNTTSIPQGSPGDTFSNLLASVMMGISDVTSFTEVAYPGISNALTGINDGYHPKYSVSATVSGWLDLNGDGVPEFVATPAWIERFQLDQSCWVTPAIGAAPQSPDALNARITLPATDSAGNPDTQWRIAGLNVAADNATVQLGLDAQLEQLAALPPASMRPALGPPGPLPLPLSYDTSTGSSEGFGLSIPIGGLINATISSIECQCWYSIAAAAPGLTIDTFSPHGSTGFTFNIPAPSAQATLQGVGSLAASNASASSVASFISSLVKVNLDLTLVSPTQKNRSESRVQVLDLNGDGLPDYLLYNSGTSIAGALPGSLVAFINSPSGFGPPQVINRGFDFITPPPDFAALDADVDAAVKDAANMKFAEAGFTGIASCVGFDIVGCADYLNYTTSVNDLANKANDVLNLSGNFLSATTDALPRERQLASEILGLVGVARGLATASSVLPSQNLVEATTLASQGLVSDLGFYVRSLHHIGYSSRINVIGEGFSVINGSQVSQGNGEPTFSWTDGISYQTRGFVDLNGDGLPDYVMTDSRAEANSPCGANQWAVFWGTGTSSISNGSAFLQEADGSGRIVPDCINVPALPSGLSTGSGVLPLNADSVARPPEFGTTSDSRIQTFVALIDINHDGRPDIVIVRLDPHSSDATPFPCNASSWVWDVFLNNGNGFSTTPDMSIPAPRTNIPLTQIEPASTLAQCLNADAPSMRTTHSATTVAGTVSRDTSDTHTAMIDFDGDGNQDVLRRVHILKSDGSKREGMLLWTRQNGTGPEDLMIEERFPIEGSRNLVEYRSAVDFQWTDAKPDGQAPQFGHRSLAGVPAQLVRSVTTERLFGLADKRTRRGYDYKLPFFDMSIRESTGFALRSSFALDPTPDDATAAEPVAQSVANVERNAQRPEALPGLTQRRSIIVQTGAPVSETLMSYVESHPTTQCPGIGSAQPDPLNLCPAVGGLDSIFAAPARSLAIEYPSGLHAGPIFDVGFDGREPWANRVTGQAPLAPPAPCPQLNDLLSTAPVTTEPGTVPEDGGEPIPEPTGGGARFAPGAIPTQCPRSDSDPTLVPFVLQYPNPAYPAVPNQANLLLSSTVELWLKPQSGAGMQVILDQAGGYRLLLLDSNGQYQWQLQLGQTDCAAPTANCITSAPQPDAAKNRWHYLVATFGPDGGGVFEDGRDLPVTFLLNGQPVTDLARQPFPPLDSTGVFAVGCGASSPTSPSCFVGDIGELRVYPERWPSPPRVTDLKTTFNLPDLCRFDGGVICPLNFGQPLVVRNRNDSSLTSDDIATQYEYATPVGSSPVIGLRSTQAQREILADGSLGNYLTYNQHLYDGLPLYQVSNGNGNQTLLFDGSPQPSTPTASQMPVSMEVGYGTDCPGMAISHTDPLHDVTRTTWDVSCSFQIASVNALGEMQNNTYYGVNFIQSGSGRSGPFGTFVLQGRYGQAAEVVDPNGATTLSTYDIWGRPAALWSPLDRADRPGVITTYEDAICNYVAIETTDPNYPLTPCDNPATVTLHTPAVTLTRTWDDELRRCLDQQGTLVSCASAGSERFAAESPTGDYRSVYRFGDGQIQQQGVFSGKPAWTLTGIADFDPLGRTIRNFKIQYLPGACPPAGTWCDSTQAAGVPLRGVAKIQQAYDTQGRVIRTYGPGWPTCVGDPSSPVVATDGLPTGALLCDMPTNGVAVNDVTQFAYPTPGEALTIDGNGVPTRVRRDARGLTSAFEEYLRPPVTAPPYASVAYSYDILGRLTGRADQDGNASVTAYDALSRRTSSTDPDLGTTTYGYDLRSELTERIAASGEKMQHAYDAVGRVVQTDYLRPVPGQTQATSPSGGQKVQYPKVSIPVATSVPDIPKLDPMKYWPDPPEQFATLSLSGEGGQLMLPFSVDIRAPGSELQHDYLSLQGSTVLVEASGQLQILAGALSAGQSKRQTRSVDAGIRLVVISPELGLHDATVRYAVYGTENERRLTVEWSGRLRAHAEQPVRVRATISEGSGKQGRSVVRYDYIEVPTDLKSGSSVRLVDGASTYLRFLEPYGSEPRARVRSNTSFALGGAADNTLYGARWRGSASGSFRLAYSLGKGQDPTLRLGYRLFSNCEPKYVGQCDGTLQIGYRDPSARSGSVQTLAVTPVSPRPLERSQNAEREALSWAEFSLPASARGKPLELLIDVRTNAKLSQAGLEGMLQFLWPRVTQTDYLLEERVYRTYDSHEPPYYIESIGGKTYESKPLLDVTFDVPGIPVDRSPNNMVFDAQSCAFAGQQAHVLTGASGRALDIPAGAQCKGAFSQTHTVSGLTLEAWLKPGVCAAPGGPGACAQQSIVMAANSFGLSLLPSGYLQCTAGGASARSDEPLPTDSWTHVALVLGSGQVTCVVNGVQQAQTAHAPTGAFRVPLTLTLGQLSPATGFPVDVGIDELRLIGSARTTVDLREDALRPVRAGPPRGDLVHLDFDHPITNGQADQSGAGNDAQLSGGRIIPGVEAMSYDTESHPGTAAVGGIRIPRIGTSSPPTLALADQITTELWIKRRASANNPTQQSRLVGKWKNANTPGWRFQIEPVSGRLHWEIVTHLDAAGGGSQQHDVFVTHETVPVDAWHHLAATYDGARMRVFLDGVPLHPWCGSGSLDHASTVTLSCTDPPAPTPCTVETQMWAPKDAPPNTKAIALGDAECISGSIDNSELILAANDNSGPVLDGVLDELRVSNYAKREFEVVNSARVASAYTQAIGRGTMLRNRLFGQAFADLSGTLPCDLTPDTDPTSNDQPYDLAHQPARELRSFDLQGRLVDSVKNICGQKSPDGYFLSRASVDSATRTGSVLYPHGEVLVSRYGLDGTPSSLTGFGAGIGHSAAQSESYISNAETTITGQPAVVLYGNGVSTSWSYDDGPVATPAGAAPSGAFGPDSLKAVAVQGVGGAKLSDRSYQWDSVGNLLQVTDTVAGSAGVQYEATYTYDGLRRAATANLQGLAGGQPLHWAYCYDRTGNLVLIDGNSRQTCYDASDNLLPLSVSNLLPGDGAIQDYGAAFLDATCPSPSSRAPHALTRRREVPGVGGGLQSSPGWCYDAAGKLLWSDARDFTYFAREKARAVVARSGSSQTSEQLVYDGDGVRVRKTDSTGQTYIIPSPFFREIHESNGTPSYEALYGSVGTDVARRVLHPLNTCAPQTSDLYWFDNDHLRGTYFMTDPAGSQVVGSRAYYRPFGQMDVAGSTPAGCVAGEHLFTSKELDITGLYDFGARLYDPESGRFTQADDVDSGSSQQALNRYSYVLENPQRLIDPDGHEAAVAQSWQANDVTPSEGSEADEQLAAHRAGVGARMPLHQRALLDSQTAGYFASPQSHFSEAVDQPPTIFNYVPGARAGWLLGEVWTGETISGAPTRFTLGDVATLAIKDWANIDLLATGTGFLEDTAGEVGSLMRAQAAQEAWWEEQMTLRARLESVAEPLNARSPLSTGASHWNAHAQGVRGGFSSFPPYSGGWAQANPRAQEMVYEILNSNGRIEIHYGDGITAVYDPNTWRGAAFDNNNRFLGFRDMGNPQFRVRTDVRAP